MAKTYFISFNGIDFTEFYPSNRPKVTNVQQPGERFFRARVDQFSIPRVTNSTILDTLESYFFDDTKFSTTLNFKIKKSGVDTFFYRMSVNEGEFDTEKKVFKCTPRPDDDYQDILDLYEKSLVDLTIPGLYGLDTTLFVLEKDPASAEFTEVGVDPDFDFADTAGDIVWDNDSASTNFASKAYTGDDANGNVCKIVFVDFTGDNFNVYLADNAGVAKSNSVVVNADKTAVLTQNAGGATKIYLEFAAGDDGTVSYQVFTPQKFLQAGTTLLAFIERLLTGAPYLNLTYDVVSTYLWNDALGSDPPPNIDTYISGNPTNDYVIEGAAVWNDLFVTKTHLFTTDKNPSLTLTFKDVMDFIKIKLRAFWHLDEDGKFRIEHEKYYRDFATQLNVTTAPETSDKPEIDVSVFSYDKSSIFGTLNYSEDNEFNTDFLPEPILYDNELTTPNSVDISASIQISTDAGFIVDTDNSVDNNGLSLFQCFKSGADYFVDINASYYDADIYFSNQRLSWAHVMDNYFGYFAEANAGTVNTDAKNFDAVKEFLKQTGIKFYYDGELDWRKPVTTANGLCWLEQWEESEDEFLTINVGYDPYL